MQKVQKQQSQKECELMHNPARTQLVYNIQYTIDILDIEDTACIVDLKMQSYHSRVLS